MKRIALLGMPNTGKSTFFNRFTGANARVGNWPGITVDLMSAKLPLGDQMAEIVDLPGIYDLPGDSEDERVVEHFLNTTPVDLVLVILNSSQIERQLSLLLQVQQLGIPCIALLNMSDEAKKFGVRIDESSLSEQLGIPIFSLSAKYGEGFEQVKQKIAETITHINKAQSPSNDKKVSLKNIDNTELEKRMQEIVEKSIQIPVRLSDNLTQGLDKLFLHTWLGLPLFFLVMYLVFQAVFFLGEPLQDGVEQLLGLLRVHALEPLLASTPTLVQGFLLDGVYDGVGTVATFVPIILLFFFFMTIVEDSGYLSRAAFLMDALMSKVGLDGRSFVMLLMGFGCNVPALMGTRVMRSRGLRLLSMLVIPFSLCTARLQVFVFFIAALFSPSHAPLALLSLYFFSFFTAFITALLFKGKYRTVEPFIIEVPPYRLPTLQQIIIRSWHEVRHFLQRATTFIIIGVVLVWVLTNFPSSAAPASVDTWAGIMGAWLSPIFDPIGVDQKLTIALLFGFVAKEIVIGALAVIYALEEDGLGSLIAQQMDWVQAYSFMLFTLVYTPCLSTIATIRSESRSNTFTAISLIWPLFFAWFLSFVFYQGARALGY